MRSAQVFGLATGLCLAAACALAQDVRPVPRPTVPGSGPGSGPGSESGSALAETESPTLVISSKSPVPRPPDLMQGHGLRFALAAARRGDWSDAGKIASGDSTVAADVIEWQRLRAGKGTFPDYRVFLGRNGDWPGLKLLRKKGEATIPENSAYVHVIDYFKPEPPQTGYGALRLVAAFEGAGMPDKARAELRRAWTGLDMNKGEEAAWMAAHGDALKPLHETRLDFALWEKENATAARARGRVDAEWRALADARLAVQRRAGGLDRLIDALPDALAGDPGLAWDRMNWNISKRRRGAAADIIIAQSKDAKSLGRPAYWSDWRRVLARQEMRAGNGERAYALASTHHLEPGSNFADLEWLSGYLALRYLDDPARALDHFQRFRTAVFTPISLGRAGYWEGRALEAMGDTEAAMLAYRDAARWQTSFYGLLAAEKAGVAMDEALTGRLDLGTWRGTAFSQTSVFAAAQLFHKANQPWEVGRFLRHLAEMTDPGEHVALSDYALSLGDPYLTVRVAKQIASEGTVAPRAYYPLTPIGEGALPVPEELALSIARRESEFHIAAVSGAGARGLMQLMPATAQDMARKVGLSYSRAKLTTDPVYNATLGSAYLAHLKEEFGNNIVLVSVGYNAGPHRSRTWVKDRGDPRGGEIDVVDWIEHIPFRETRNYVMRVAESLPVYRARLTGKVAPIRLSAELVAR